VDLVILLQQQFRQIRSVLSRDAGDESAFHLCLMDMTFEALRHARFLRLGSVKPSP
jgi:hypothetical protein